MANFSDCRPTCACVEEIEKALAVHNTMIVTELFSGRVAIATDKKDGKKRGRPLAAIASYCPFCGKAYASKEVA